VAFYQPVCISDPTWQTALTHWLFVQGGGLIMIVGICLATLLLLGWKITKPFGKDVKYLPKQHTSFA
jgi:hypothetical protein